MNIVIENKQDKLQRAREHAYAMPLKDFHPGAPQLFASDTLWPYFERLRREEPVHYCANSPIEPYWSITKYNDIMHVEINHGIFSSDLTLGGISIRDTPPGYEMPSFITMDEPRHSAQRKTVAPMFTPSHLDQLADLIRERAIQVLDAATERDVRFCRSGVGRADDADARNPVRFPVGGKAQADPLVRHLHGAAEEHGGGIGRAASGRNAGVRQVFYRTLE
jgi:hypothetical protein